MLTKPDIEWLKSEFLPDLADAVEEKLRSKLDELSKKLDLLEKQPPVTN